MSGTVILVIIILLFLFMATLGFYCHFCFGESGGRSLQVMEPGAPVKVTVIPLACKSKCKCSDKFKGICKSCEGQEFVGSDGGVRPPPDYSGFGGDNGFAPQDSNSTDKNLLQGLLRESSMPTDQASVPALDALYSSNY